MKKAILFILTVSSVFFVFPRHEAKAMDPVTMGILAPVALQMAKKASPYIIRGLSSAGKGCVACGRDLLDFFRLPLGMGQTMVMGPFGYYRMGLRNMALGAAAPFKFAFHTAILPVLLFKIT